MQPCETISVHGSTSSANRRRSSGSSSEPCMHRLQGARTSVGRAEASASMADGSSVGATDGSSVGTIVGSSEGDWLGLDVGDADGERLEANDGVRLGCTAALHPSCVHASMRTLHRPKYMAHHHQGVVVVRDRWQQRRRGAQQLCRRECRCQCRHHRWEAWKPNHVCNAPLKPPEHRCTDACSTATHVTA